MTTFLPPESTYRPVSIPLPLQAKIGERWRLGLSSASSSTSLLDLSGEDVRVIGVWSEGIEITPGDLKVFGVIRGIGGQGKVQGKGKGKGKGNPKEGDEAQKQTRIWRSWALPGGGDLRVVEQTSFDLDKVRSQRPSYPLAKADTGSRRFGILDWHSVLGSFDICWDRLRADHQRLHSSRRCLEHWDKSDGCESSNWVGSLRWHALLL